MKRAWPAVLTFFLVGVPVAVFVGLMSQARFDGDLVYAGPANWLTGIAYGVGAGGVAFLLVAVVTVLVWRRS